MLCIVGKGLIMKHGNTYYAQIPRTVWDIELSDKARLLFFWLNELEQRYTNEKREYFYRSDEQLASDLGWSERTVKYAKKELRQSGLIETSYIRWWLDDEHTVLSKKKVTSYRIM